jgi:hypothetical protein
LTVQIASPKKKRRSRKSKLAAGAVQAKKESHVTLLPKVIGSHVVSQGQTEILDVQGQIQVQDHWTTEALIEKLEAHIVQVRNQQPYSPASSFSDTRKYLRHAIEVITNWSKVEQTHRNHQFIFNLSDILLNERLAAELVALGRTAPSTLAYVLHEVVRRLFGMVSARWFYESAGEEIKVVLQP